MMKSIRLVQEMSGTRDYEPWPPVGSDIEVPDEEAEQMVEFGWAAWTPEVGGPPTAEPK